MEKDRLIEELESLYYLLRDEAYPEHANEIKSVIMCLINQDNNSLEKTYNSSFIWGGAGSILDIDFRDINKNQIKDKALKLLKDYKKKG